MDKVILIVAKVYYNTSDRSVENYNIRIGDLYNSKMPDQEVDVLIRDLIMQIKLLERRAKNAKKHKRMGAA